MAYREIWRETAARIPALLPAEEAVMAAHAALRDCFAAGGKLLVGGNGGSAADAEHIVSELMKGFVKARALNEEACCALVAADADLGFRLASTLQGALPAIALGAHTALSTAFANDRDPVAAFAQQVWGYGREGDVLLAISTSGNAENLCLAAVAAKAKGMRVIALTGSSGGKLRGLADIAICVPEHSTHRVQELHLPLYHALCMMLESDFFEA